MATASSRASLVAQLRKNRTSSPQMEEYATATSQSFDAARDAIHSTAQIPDYTTEQHLPQQYQQHYENMSDNASEGSAEMSIELGRGVKRGARERDEDLSSNAVFQLGGGDSLYELTGTPPIRSRNTSARKTDDGLRRQASIRRATDTAKTAGNAKRSTSLKQNTLTDALNKVNAEDETSFFDEQPATATFNARNTRFSRSRQTSLQEQARAGSAQQTPRRGANNATAQSNSFILPDLPNLTELVSGVRKDGTPVFNLAAKSRSRFTSGSHKPSRPEYNPVESVPIPDEEKAIYSSLQVLQARLAQLEDEKEDAEKRAEEYEGVVIDLRSQLAVSQGRPDSGLGSDEERSGSEKTKLRASIKSLQARLDRSERKLTNSEITCKRITNERDQLLQQIGVAYYNIEDLKQENEGVQVQAVKLQAENDGLKGEVDELRREVQGLRLLAQQTQASYDEDSMQRDRREADLKRRLDKRTQMARDVRDTTRELWEVQEQNARKQSAAPAGKRHAKQSSEAAHVNNEPHEEPQYGDLESRVAEAVARARREALGPETAEVTRRSRSNQQEQAAPRSSSKSATRTQTAGIERRASGHKRTTSARKEVDLSDAESTTQLDFSRHSRNATTKRASLPSPVKAKAAAPREEDGRDLTLLTWTDPAEFAKLRKKLEEERKAERNGRTVSAPAQQETTSQFAGLPRKSSLRDVTAGFDEGTGRFSIASGNAEDFNKITKSVRVQSPHTSDESVHAPQAQQSEAGDTSVLSNTSRRRRRAASAEGMTSAFILPDITLHGSKLTNGTGSANISHDAKSCTACPAGKDATIPTPVPVTDREIDLDITSATIRPAEEPAVALARVIKENEDEIRHLKLQLASATRQYNQHDPALSMRRRHQVNIEITHLSAKIEKLSDQVYRLYDVLEGQKQAAEAAAKGSASGAAAVMSEQEVEDTLESIGIDPAELAGRVGRKAAPFGLDGADDGLSEDELPGFSDGGSVQGGEFEGREFGDERRRSGIF